MGWGDEVGRGDDGFGGRCGGRCLVDVRWGCGARSGISWMDSSKMMGSWA